MLKLKKFFSPAIRDSFLVVFALLAFSFGVLQFIFTVGALVDMYNRTPKNSRTVIYLCKDHTQYIQKDIEESGVLITEGFMDEHGNVWVLDNLVNSCNY